MIMVIFILEHALHGVTICPQAHVCEQKPPIALLILRVLSEGWAQWHAYNIKIWIAFLLHLLTLEWLLKVRLKAALKCLCDTLSWIPLGKYPGTI